MSVGVRWRAGHDPQGGDKPSPATMVLVRAVVALMVAGAAVMVIAAVLVRDQITRPWLGTGVLIAVASATVAAIVALRHEPRVLLRPSTIAAEVVLGAGLLAADGWVLTDERTFDPPTLGVIWPLAGVLSAGVVAGPRIGFVIGAIVAVARLGGAVAPDARELTFSTQFERLVGIDQPRVLPIASLAVLYAIVGAGAGYLARLQRRAETEIESARAREAVAATLHDGVLQTLAIIQRRSTDPDLTRLARRSDADLRRFLDTGVDHDAALSGLVDGIRSICADHEERFDTVVRVVIDDPPPCDGDTADALAGAAREALTNAGKHAAARTVTVYVGADVDDPNRVLVTIHDDGVGFDPAITSPGRGLEGSIRRRIEGAGGQAQLRSTPGEGTEVRLWGP